MRVEEVMPSPVVYVPPDMPFKEVADLLVNHGISAVPVVDGELVGLISEADLAPLELTPTPGPTSSPGRAARAKVILWPPSELT